MKIIYSALLTVFLFSCGGSEPSPAESKTPNEKHTHVRLKTEPEINVSLDGVYKVYQVDGLTPGESAEDEMKKTFDFRDGGLVIDGGNDLTFMTNGITFLSDSVFAGLNDATYTFRMVGDEMIIRPSGNKHRYRLKKEEK